MLRRRRPFTLALPGTDVATVTARIEALRPPRVSRTLPPHELFLRITADGVVRVTRAPSGGPWTIYGHPGLRGRLTQEPDGVVLSGEARESVANVTVDGLMWVLSLAGLLVTALALDPPLFGPSPAQIVVGGLAAAAAFALAGSLTRWTRRRFPRDVEEMTVRLGAVLTDVSPR